MKKSIFFILMAFTATVTFESFDLGKRRNGTDPGHTGSPGDSLKTCKVCHGGNEEWQPNWISSDIPSTGYIPGNTYTITATNTSPGFNRFGFQVSPQNKKGDLLGTIVITDFEQTQLVGNNKYITYTSGGVDGQDVKSWTFKWIAPSDTVNEVTFYGAFNSNHDGHKFSDKTTVSNLRVFKNGFTSIPQINSNLTNMKIFHNSVNNQLHISGNCAQTLELNINLIALNGAIVFAKKQNIQAGENQINLDLLGLNKGIYFVSIQEGNNTLVKKIVITE